MWEISHVTKSNRFFKNKYVLNELGHLARYYFHSIIPALWNGESINFQIYFNCNIPCHFGWSWWKLYFSNIWIATVSHPAYSFLLTQHFLLKFLLHYYELNLFFFHTSYGTNIRTKKKPSSFYLQSKWKPEKTHGGKRHFSQYFAISHSCLNLSSLK